jgi:hypothetical protein
MSELSVFKPVETDLKTVNASGVSDGGDYLGYVKLCGSSTDEVKKGKIGMGHYAYIVNQEPLDLSSEALVIVLAARATAMDFRGDDPTTSHDPSSSKYAEIRGVADGMGRTNCVYGPEFLIFLVNEQEYAQFHLSNKVGRRAAPKLIKLVSQEDKIVPTPVTMGVEFIEDHKPKGGRDSYSFHVPTFSPFKGELPEMELDNDKYSKVLEDFLNPKERAATAVPEDDRG